MVANKYLSQVAGVVTEITPAVTSAANAIVALDATGKLDNSIMPVGVTPTTQILVTSENLVAGALVNVYNNAGVPTARNADASTNRLAHGFVLAGTTSPANATVYFTDEITGLSALTAGTIMFLGAAGVVTATAPSTSGYSSQQIGNAITATTINFAPKSAITLA